MSLYDIEEEPPMEPSPEECCGTGCARCVWDIYYDRLADYEARMKEAKNSPRSSGGSDGGGTPKKLTPATPPSASSAILPRDNSVVLKYGDAFEDEEEEGMRGKRNRKKEKPVAVIPCTVWGREEYIRGRFHEVVASPAEARKEEGQRSTDGGNFRTVLSKFVVEVPKNDTADPEGEGVTESPPPLETSWLPGETLDVLAPNDSELVTKLLDRLGLKGDRKLMLLESPFVTPGSFPPWLPKGNQNDLSGSNTTLPLRELFEWHVDVSSLAVLKNPKLYQLIEKSASRFTPEEDKATASAMVQAATHSGSSTGDTAAGSSIIKDLVAGHGTLLDVLSHVPSISPPLAKLLGVLPRLRERRFSVANASAATTESSPEAEVFYRVPGPSSSFRGHASTPMLMGTPLWVKVPWWTGADNNTKTARRGPAAATFTTAVSQIPLSSPLVLLGGGSGVAPLRSILQSRTQGSIATGATAVASTVIVTSFRHRHENVLDSELAEWATGGGGGPQRSYWPTFSSEEGGRFDAMLDSSTERKKSIVDTFAAALSVPCVVCCGPTTFMDSARGYFTNLFQSEPHVEGRHEVDATKLNLPPAASESSSPTPPGVQWRFITEQWSTGGTH